MSQHPLNLVVRFILELVLLAIFSFWGFHRFEGFTKYIIGIGLPILAATLWGVFRVEGDPGKATVVIPGWLRLLYEAILFITAAYFLFQLGWTRQAYVFIIISTLHYLVSYDRIVWLLQR